MIVPPARLLHILIASTLTAAAGAQQPLQPPPVPPENPVTAEKAVLGKMLFWEEQLSSDNRMACGTCHLTEAGGTDVTFGRHPGTDGVFQNEDDTTGSIGVRRADGANEFVRDAQFAFDRQVTARKASSVLNAAYFDALLWDGRAAPRFDDPLTGQTLIPWGGALESQAVEPILDSAEMAHDGRTWAEVTAKLARVQPMALATDLPSDVRRALATAPTYPDLFAAAFGDTAITPARIAYALATYERTLVPDQTPYDDYLRGNGAALTTEQLRGLQVFVDPQNGCNVCHAGHDLSDGSFRFTGVRPATEDPGRFAVSGRIAERGAFKVPALRNVALHRTFMHSGEFATLAEVVDFYNRPPIQNGRDPLIQPLGLDAQERADLVAFLEALTDPRVAGGTAPFSRPTLHSERVQVGANQFGTASPSGVAAPKMISEGAAARSLPDFRVGIQGAVPWAPALFGLALGPAAPGTLVQGVPVLIDDASMWLVPVALSAEGAGTLRLSIPPDPVLRGLQVFGQWFVPDPTRLYRTTRGATWTMF